jgi:hypothetical protein
MSGGGRRRTGDVGYVEQEKRQWSTGSSTAHMWREERETQC